MVRRCFEGNEAWVHYGPLVHYLVGRDCYPWPRLYNTYHHHVDAASLNLSQLGVGHTIGRTHNLQFTKTKKGPHIGDHLRSPQLGVQIPTLIHVFS